MNSNRSLSLRSVSAGARLTACAGAALMLALFAATPAAARALEVAEARGTLMLAWGEYDSGRCESALKYLTDDPPGEVAETSQHDDSLTELLEQWYWLKVECLGATGGHAEATKLLFGAAAAYQWRIEALRSVTDDWLYELSATGAYDEGERVVKAALDAAGHDPYLDALARANSHRKELNAFVLGHAEAGAGPTPLKAGGEAVILLGDAKPEGERWRQACPGDTGCDHWLGQGEKALVDAGASLWLRADEEDLAKSVEFEAGRIGLGVGREGDGLRTSLEDFTYHLPLNDVVHAALLDGYGIRGGALVATAVARQNLERLTAMASWMQEKIDGGSTVDMRRQGNLVELVHTGTGRSFVMNLDSWADDFSDYPDEWASFWDEVTTELGREPRPFVCFCGRHVVLRQTLVDDWEGLVTTWHEGEAASVLLASCELHWRYVTPALLGEWGIDEAAAVDTARRDAEEREWEVTFHRNLHGDAEYLVFAGTAVSGMIRTPELLSGMLEALEGRSFADEEVAVAAPASDLLLVEFGGKDLEMLENGAGKALEQYGVERSLGGPIGFGKTIRLPAKAAGKFVLSPDW